MVSMKLSKKESDTYMGVAPESGDGPAYPWGLCINLDTETLAKLGMTEPPAVGSELTLTAKVVVTSVGSSQQQDGDRESRCELQITEMDLAGGTASASQVLYANSKMNP